MTGSRRQRPLLLPHLGALLLGIALSAAGLAQQPSVSSPAPGSFADALRLAADELFAQASFPGDRVEFVIDPLIESASGAQSAGTRSIQQQLAERIEKAQPRMSLQPFSDESLAREPLVLIGTLTPISADGTGSGPRDALQLCLGLADLRSGTITSRSLARSRSEGVDMTPTPFFRDAPVWTRDEATDAYVRSCQGTKPGDPLDPAYLERLRAAALVAEGIARYEGAHFREALAFFRSARALPGGDQHRARLGTYLAAAKLGRRDDAIDAFGELVDRGLDGGQLMLKLQFKPGTTQLVEDGDMTEAYPMWLSQIASRARARGACLEIVGHTSRSGLPNLNERLSVLRAQFVMGLLEAGAPDTRSRMIATGMGFRENLVGTGKDDASDALDRRVEFKAISC